MLVHFSRHEFELSLEAWAEKQVIRNPQVVEAMADADSAGIREVDVLMNLDWDELSNTSDEAACFGTFFDVYLERKQGRPDWGTCVDVLAHLRISRRGRVLFSTTLEVESAYLGDAVR